MAYLQRAIGYTLTGDTKEQLAFTCHGSGSNGKTTLLQVLHRMLGNGYAAELPGSVFEKSKQAAIPNDMMLLYERRLATVTELPEGAVINEARFKQITGGDQISARYLYREFITFFTPAKVWFAVNHLPVVLDDTYAFWRRVHVIPFRHQFTGGEVDKHLVEKLSTELPGIFNWSLHGCLEYRRQGLNPPALVVDAVAAYQRESNPVLKFVEEACERVPGVWTSSRNLYDTYQIWASENGEPVVTRRGFSTRLKNLGVKPSRSAGQERTRGYEGIRLRPATNAIELELPQVA